MLLNDLFKFYDLEATPHSSGRVHKTRASVGSQNQFCIKINRVWIFIFLLNLNGVPSGPCFDGTRNPASVRESPAISQLICVSVYCDSFIPYVPKREFIRYKGRTDCCDRFPPQSLNDPQDRAFKICPVPN